MRTFAALVLCIASAGCRLDRTGASADASFDAAPDRDAGEARRDTGPGRDGGGDAGAMDAGSLDAGAPDGGPPDAGPPDAGPPDAGGRPCDETFRGIDGFRLCDETEMQCRFYARTAGVSCATLCGDHGASCFDSWAETSDEEPCRPNDTEYDCGYGHGDGICLCSRP